MTPSPSHSPNFGRFHQYEAQQRHLQEQMDDLAAQMATFTGQTALPLGLEFQQTPTTAPEQAHMATVVPDMDEEQGPGLPTTEECFQIQQSIRFGFPATNNCSEYEAL